MSDQSEINENQSKVNEQATETVDKLVKAARWRTWTLGLLWVVTIVLILVVFKGHFLVQDVQHGAFQSCVSGNNARMANVSVWRDFINILLSGDKKIGDPAHQAGANFLNYLAAHEKPQNCAALYPTSPWWHFW